ncbi:N-6 DNA methylase [Paenibacillus sp. PCH8]|uniref:N-6 DNA methylase n=1 Tax=Paenibacillus sp. PCH8 TaxID=2066524 RepID=UPI001C61349F|nr:N-6 DNA methylase [Paenibacillus sp. PCH8]
MYQVLFDRLRQARFSWQNEEELRIGWIKEFSQTLNIEMQAERQRQDSSYNNVIIEFKSPGLFRGRKSSPAFRQAMNERLQPYILSKALAEGISPENYIGIATDGDHICFAKISNNKIIYGELLSFSLASVTMVGTALLDSYRRAITVTNLVDDFGILSSIGVQLMQTLADALSFSICQSEHNKIKMIFEEWQTLFGQVSDLTHGQKIQISKIIQFEFPTEFPHDLTIPGSLFIIHTYNSLVIKLLAAEVVSAHGLSSRDVFSQTIATYSDDKLLRELSEQIEKGLLFESAGIKGFIEEAIFSWYVDICHLPEYKANVLALIRDILIKISFYRADTLTEMRTRDVLKGFYQNLVPDALRKSLGEFYTPDWLVEFTLNKLDSPNWLNDRILDPTCGSGSFLLEVIRRIRSHAVKVGIKDEDILRILTENVWGFDLNPLAVQTSRVNYLIAIADLLQSSRGKIIELPILLADAIYSPARQPNHENELVTYTIGSEVANLEITIPVELAFDRSRLDRIFILMSEMVNNAAAYTKVKERLVLAELISQEESVCWDKPLCDTYNQVLELHIRNWNGIWFRIVRNFFWSITAGSFQIVVGNPPWVRWSNLPELYRNRIKPTCRQYEIFSSTPHHGGNELDVSGMITYTVADKWLEHGGQLAFVLTQAHFQTPSSEGFRSFSINEVDRLIPLSVDDFKSLKPFHAANKTAVAHFRKKKYIEPTYPLPYNVWSSKKGSPKLIPSNITLEEVKARIQVEHLEAVPVNGLRSPWSILPPGRFQAMNKITGISTWVRGRKGVTTDLNGVYFVRIIDQNKSEGIVRIETRPEAGKKDIGAVQKFWIEPHMLYPLIKGAGDFSECSLSIEEELFVIVPNLGVNRRECNEAEIVLDTQAKRTKRYFNYYEQLLRSRSTWKRYLKGKPFYSIYNIGDYAFSPYKVIWAEQSSRFKAAVVTETNVPLIGKRPFIPDHKVFYVACWNSDEAYYLCGLLNSNIVKEYVESHVVSINVGNIFKHMNLVEFSQENQDHHNLARLVKEAHRNNSEDLLSKIRDAADRIILGD